MAELSVILVQHLNTLFSVYTGGYVNTGSKMADNAIITIINTVFGMFLGYIIYVFVKGGWQIEMRRFGISKKSPTQFKVESIETPKSFSFVIPFSQSLEMELFCKWMLENNTDKLKKGSIVVSKSLFEFVSFQSEDVDKDIESYYADTWLLQKSLRESLVDPVPIWMGSDYQFVFAVKGSNPIKDVSDEYGMHESETICLCSNSTTALREAVESILKSSPNTKKEFEEKNMLKVYKTYINAEGSRTRLVVEKTGLINSRKSFNSLFFKSKPMLMTMLKKLKTKQLGSDMNGLENKLGIMLYGPPGTGKTGVIQAIANYMGRSIVMINLSSIKDSKMLDEVFKGRDKKDYIFVFEEIDCMGDIVMKRSNTPSAPKDTTNETMMEMVTAVASMSSGGKSNMKDKMINGKLELGHILSKIDGIESNEDAIYIATTNRIEVLDDALIRPGRFGFKLELSYCDRDMLTDIISMILGLNESNRTYLYEHIPDKAINNIKPVEIIQQCQIENDLERIIKYLKKF
jgi:hypothetical protein